MHHYVNECLLERERLLAYQHRRRRRHRWILSLEICLPTSRCVLDRYVLFRQFGTIYKSLRVRACVCACEFTVDEAELTNSSTTTSSSSLTNAASTFFFFLFLPFFTFAIISGASHYRVNVVSLGNKARNV